MLALRVGRTCPGDGSQGSQPLVMLSPSGHHQAHVGDSSVRLCDRDGAVLWQGQQQQVQVQVQVLWVDCGVPSVGEACGEGREVLLVLTPQQVQVLVLASAPEEGASESSPLSSLGLGVHSRGRGMRAGRCFHYGEDAAAAPGGVRAGVLPHKVLREGLHLQQEGQQGAPVRSLVLCLWMRGKHVLMEEQGKRERERESKRESLHGHYNACVTTHVTTLSSCICEQVQHKKKMYIVLEMW